MNFNAIRSVLIRLGYACILLFLLNSCSVERRLAMNYAQQLDSLTLMYFPVNDLILYQLDSLPSGEINDEPWLTNSFTDSFFLATYNAVFIEELKKYGVNLLFLEQSDVFFENKQALIINMAQFEIEEVYKTEREEEQFDTLVFYYDYPIRYVIMNFWMEVSALNTQKSIPVNFSSYFASDHVQNIFTQNQITGEVKVSYQNRKMTPTRVDQLIRQSARQNAANLIDDLINRSVLNDLGKHYNPKMFHYRYEDKKLERVESLPYILMEP